MSNMKHPLSSTDISVSSPEIRKFCYIKKYRYRVEFDTQFLILLAFVESFVESLVFIRIWPEKPLFFEVWSWFKFNNLGLALGTNLKFYTSVIKGLKLKVGRFLGLIPTFVEVTGKKLVGRSFFNPPGEHFHCHPIF